MRIDLRDQIMIVKYYLTVTVQYIPVITCERDRNTNSRRCDKREIRRITITINDN